MTEVERAEQIAREPRRRFWQNIAMVLGLVLGLSLLFLLWYQLQQRADSAETSAVSLAEQVQERCDTEGSLLVGDRDLCEQADDVVEDPGGVIAPANGRDGDDATDAQVAAGVAAWFATHDLSLTTGYSEAMQDAVARYLSRNPPPPGKPGKDAPPLTDRQISDAVATYLIAHPPTDGTNGTNGRGVADTSLDGCHVVFTYTDGSTDRIGPICGKDGSDGRGYVDVECHTTGDWIFTYDDGTATTATGPCRGADGDDGEQGTAKPGDYACPENEYVTAFSIAADGAVTLACASTIPPVTPNP